MCGFVKLLLWPAAVCTREFHCPVASQNVVLLATAYDYETSLYRPYANMAAATEHKLNFIIQRNEPHHEKEHVKISDTAKFQSCWPNTRGMVDI